MIEIELNKNLTAFNSLGFTHYAERFASIRTEAELVEIINHARLQQWPIHVIGEGSNLVLTQDIVGLVIHLSNDSIDYEPAESESTRGGADASHPVQVRAGAGVNWHKLVQLTVQKGINGLENLSLIPGSVGAAPVQNIGAYGVEAKDRIQQVRALHLPSMQWLDLSAKECQFSYRNSLFKTQANEFIITQVTFTLGDQHGITTHYQPLADYLSKQSTQPPTANQVSQAVIAIRQSKLPDPAVLANAGSFFQNPVVTLQKADALKEQYPAMVAFPLDAQTMKLSAAWMIDQLGFKGTRRNGVGVYEKQALVLINEGHGTSEALLSLANEIMQAVEHRFGVQLVIEPVVI